MIEEIFFFNNFRHFKRNFYKTLQQWRVLGGFQFPLVQKCLSIENLNFLILKTQTLISPPLKRMIPNPLLLLKSKYQTDSSYLIYSR